MTEVIKEFNGRYRFLSNFYEADFRYLNTVWATGEHAYQAQKSTSEHWYEAIRLAKSPGQAKMLGNKCPMKGNWDEIKDGVMLSMCRAKFEVPMLRKALIATGDAELIEGNFWNDRYWGVCNGVGQNKLGKILMQIRDEIR